jgi:hypothetical protein
MLNVNSNLLLGNPLTSNLPTEPKHQTDIVLASTLFLFSSYARTKPNENLRNILLRHLEILADDEALSPVLRGICEQLELDWRNATVPTARTMSITSSKSQSTSPLVWLFGQR